MEAECSTRRHQTSSHALVPVKCTTYHWFWFLSYWFCHSGGALWLYQNKDTDDQMLLGTHIDNFLLAASFLILAVTILKFSAIKLIVYLFELGKSEFAHFFYLNFKLRYFFF
jgi:hypothetical protein